MVMLTAAQLQARAEKCFPGIMAGDPKSFGDFYDSGVKSTGRTDADTELDYAGLQALFATNSQKYSDQQLTHQSVSQEENRYIFEWSWTAVEVESGEPIAVAGRTVVAELSGAGKVRREATIYFDVPSAFASRSVTLGLADMFEAASATPRDPGSLASATPRDPGSTTG